VTAPRSHGGTEGDAGSQTPHLDAEAFLLFVFELRAVKNKKEIRVRCPRG
jgi:hypothetical protein